MNIRKCIDHFPASLPKPHKKSCKFEICSFFAEREGFEPPVPLGTAVFKTAVIDHSTTFPICITKISLQPAFLNCAAKVGVIFESANFRSTFFLFLSISSGQTASENRFNFLSLNPKSTAKIFQLFLEKKFIVRRYPADALE